MTSTCTCSSILFLYVYSLLIFYLSPCSKVRCHNYADNIECVTPSLFAEVEMEFQHINQWSLNLLRDTSIEMEKTYNQYMERKPPGLDCECYHLYSICVYCTILSVCCSKKPMVFNSRPVYIALCFQYKL